MDWQWKYREWRERNEAPGAVTMKEEEWLRCPLATVMLRFLYAYPNGRKRRLFAIACVRRIADSIPTRFLPFIDIAEGYVEGRISAAELQKACTCAFWMHDGDEDMLPEGVLPPCEYDETLTEASRYYAVCVYHTLEAPACFDHPDQWVMNDAAGWVAETAAMAASFLAESRKWDDVKIWKERAAQADLLRDIFGNPFHPIAFDPAWRTTEVVHLARKMVEMNNFQRMNLLGKALQVAGCQEKTILAHCHTNRPHVRGCWLMDAILVQ